MADIALFVAEDFERRMRRWEKGEQRGGFEFSSTVTAIASDDVFVVEAKVMEKPVFVQKEVVKSAEELERSFHLNVINGFFSA